MSDGIHESSLGALPNAGYSTERQKSTSDLVMFWLRWIERNRLTLLAIVVDGPEKWKQTAGKVWDLNRAGRSTAMSSELLMRVWDYMVKLAGPNPAEQMLILMGQRQQQHVGTYDFRQSTKVKAAKALRTALADVRKYGR